MGKKGFCHNYKLNYKIDLPDHRDLLYKTVKPSGIVLPPKVDLRPTCSPIEDQGQLGSCTANAISGALEFLENKNKVDESQDFFHVSRLFVYYNERVIDGDPEQDAGSSLRTGIKTLTANGYCDEALWPYDVSKFAVKPTDECYVAAKKYEIKEYRSLENRNDCLTCLAEGYPFTLGITLFESFESDEVARTGNVPMPDKDEQCLGGHAVLAVGYDQSTRRFLIRNSWGLDWGQAGYFTLTYDYLNKLAVDFWTIRK